MHFIKFLLRCLLLLCVSIGTYSRELPKRDKNCMKCLKSILVFGDSLSDQGMPHGLWSFDNKTIPSASFGYKKGRFTNHQVWSQYLGEKYGLDVLSYAVGGATVNNFSIGVPVTIETEVAEYARYLGTHQPLKQPSAAFIFIGSNDFDAIADYPSLNSNASNLQTFLINLVEGIANTVQEVLQFGYQNVVIVNIPPLDMTPALASPEKALFRMEFRSLLTAVNANIAKVIAAINATAGPTGVTIIPFDVNALTTDILIHAQKHGFTNISSPCLVTNPPFQNSNADATVVSTCPNPKKYFFWDGMHPTERGHRILAKHMASTLKSHGLLC